MRSRRAILWCVAGAVLVAGAVALWDLIRESRSEARVAREAAQVAAMIPRPDDHSLAFDAVRAFVFDHSVHDVDDPEFDELRRHLAFTTALMARATGARAKPVPMECATRSNAMGAMLRELGYQTRQVAMFDTDSPILRSHTFLDVLNPDTGLWESQDPDRNLYWWNPTTKTRASLFDGAESALLSLEPCPSDGCGWDDGSLELHRLLDVLTLVDKEAGTKRSIYTSRAKPDGPFEIKGLRGSFCEVMAKRCADGFGPAAP
jgi:hypothetical protein